MWKRLLLGTYYHASYPLRRLDGRRRAAARRAPVMILFYHRVADDAANAWTCSFDMFTRQMRWLKRRFEFVSLAEAQSRIRGGNPRACVSLTFDDGYADNCLRALPWLLRERIPCTYFVTTRHVFDGTPFPHDVAMGRRLAPNSIDELRDLAAAGIEIGAHTRTHPDLGALHDRARLFDEVVAAGEELQAKLSRPVRYFAFPFGLHANLSSAAFDLAYEAGYDGVCSAYGGYNFPGDDAFHLQRIHGGDDMVRLKNWVTVDPRKLRVPRFHGADAAAAGRRSGAVPA